ITTGTSPTTFDPDAALTRAHLVTFLWRYNDEPAISDPAVVTYRVSSGVSPVQSTRITVNAADPAATVTRGQAILHIWDSAGRSAGAPPHDFDDVDGIYNTAISWAAHRGVATGATDSAFSPDTHLTRADLIAILWRLAGQPKAGVPPHSFDDVDEPSHQQPVSWAAHRGITNGTSAGTFNPDAPFTHRQLNIFLNRYHKHTCR
ncbi:MAG: S-layer homology domain-containing protein, partial [Acidimicrobiaceae bacterium]|nr:S-layer homology domain-containing protein [Acidimicrobiaceae bacterium]MYA75343.1 S-layer homology domain-containing protein [Acidimicrobiaceae bacterium]MYG54647.1 S-layer homology domain-containing protein [Acidimicrobiaceae bacterium]